MNLPHPKCPTRRTTACCEQWLFLTGSWALLARKVGYSPVVGVALAWCWRGAPMCIEQLTDITQLAKVLLRGASA